jgi:hypothetical protein
MLLARDCRCAEGPRIFERGSCHRCGHLLDPIIDSGEFVDAWLLLEAAIERERMKLCADAEAKGLSVYEHIRELVLG